MRFVWFIILGCVAAGGLASPGSCGPVLNEVMADPGRDWDGDGVYDFRDDEWIEILNPGPGSLVLDGVIIGDGDGSPLVALSGTLAEGELRAIFGSEAAEFQDQNGWAIFGLRLGNDGDTVTLLQVAGADTLLVDSYTYNTYEAEDDRSSGRRPDGGPVWEMFDALNPYTGTTPPLGNGLPPTPGQANGEQPVAAVETSWGRVRAIYR